MIIIEQSEFADAPGLDAKSQPLVIHRINKGESRSGLVIFIHGLRGRRYGYWGDFPRFLSQGRADLDVGMYYYDTALRRFGLWDSIELSEEAEVLAGILRSCSSYSSIFMIAHSMGGLLAKGAIASLANADHGSALRKIRALVLLASPQVGSNRVPRLLTWFSRDAQALYPHNDFILRVDRSLSKRIDNSLRGDPRTKGNIPMAAVIASHDFWVDSVSAGIGIPEDQRMTVRGSHGSIVRPGSPQEDTYRFVDEFLSKVAGSEDAFADRDVRIRCEAPIDDDAETLHQMAREWFGPDVTPTAIISRLIRIPGIISVVRMTTQMGATKTDTILGYYCLFPLPESVAATVLSGDLRGYQIDASHLETEPTRCRTVYLGAIGADHFYARATVLAELEKSLTSYAKNGPVRVLARPFTSDGRRLVKRHGFTAVPDYPHEPALFSRSFGG